MPLREYLCRYCHHQFEEIVYYKDYDDYCTYVCRCGSKADMLPAMIGGYVGNLGSSSTRPKNSTSMKSKKAFTGNADEPTQLEIDQQKAKT